MFWGFFFVAPHELRNSLLVSIQACHCVMELFPRDLCKSLGKFFLLSEGIMTSPMRISFLPLPAPALWKGEISQTVLRDCASLVKEPVQPAMGMLMAARGGELSTGHLPGISWGGTTGMCCHILTDRGMYIILKGQNNKQDLRKSSSSLNRLRCLPQGENC